MPANANDQPNATNAPVDTSMNWVMIFWVIAFLGVVVFGIVSYLSSWYFTKG